jgi:hypothetical protein
MTTVSRRRVVSLAGLGALGAAVGVTGSMVRHGSAAATTAAAAVPFHGEHQAGIITPAQDRLHFVAFDVITEKRARCRPGHRCPAGRGTPRGQVRDRRATAARAGGPAAVRRRCDQFRALRRRPVRPGVRA